jgi:hypothetical protein
VSEETETSKEIAGAKMGINNAVGMELPHIGGYNPLCLYGMVMVMVMVVVMYIYIYDET